MKYLFVILIYLFSITAHADYIPPYQMTINSTQYLCDYTIPKTGGLSSCMSHKTPTATTYTSRGTGIPRRATDKVMNGIQLYEGNIVHPPQNTSIDAVVEWGITVYWEGIAFTGWRMRDPLTGFIYPFYE